MLLDLSFINELLDTANNIIHQIFPSEVINRVKKIKFNKLYSDTLEYLIEACEAEGIFICFDELEIEFDRKFRSIYSSLRSFHACRITNEISYRTKGIKAITHEFFVELALERFGQYASVENIEKACAETEILDSDNAVFFFPSIERAKESSQNHYLKCGSEMLQGLAWDLKLGDKGILSGQGRSCIIECEIPLAHIKNIYLFEFWRQLITFSFQASSGKVFQQKAPDWGFATKGDLSPKHIKTFHYIEDSDYEYTLLSH